MSTSIPVIDVGALVGRTGGELAVIDAIRGACETIGFFVITEHGVSAALIDRMRQCSRAFFDLNTLKKTRVPADTELVLGGFTFTPIRGEALAASLGNKTPGDLKQLIDYGPAWPGGPWPSQPVGLHAVWTDYFAAMSDLAGHLRRAFALAIGLPEHWFDNSFDNHLSSLRAIDYPEIIDPLEPGQLRAGAHSDYGFLSILLTEDSDGGLEVQPREGGWLSVPSVEKSFVINIGDVMQRWTNDVWTSTVHRVATASPNRTGSRRLSIPYFHNPNPDCTVTVLDPFVSAAQPAKYESVNYRDYALAKAAATHATTAGE